MLRKIALVCLAWILAACQSIPMGPTPTPFPESFEGTAQVGTYKMTIYCEGKGEPTIILENSVEGAYWNTSSLTRFKKISRTCWYPRVGMAGQTIEGPRTTLDQVRDLNALLKQTEVPGPYILVGHLTGDFNIILYADQYPKEVVGLVCIDCLPAGIDTVFKKKLDSQSPNNTLEFVNAKNTIDRNTAWTHWSEHLDVYAGEDQAAKVATLGDRPFIFLVAGARPHGKTIFGFWDEKVNQLYEESWMEVIQQQSKLSTHGRVESIPSEDSFSIIANPKVDAAIQEVFAAVKSTQ